MRYSGWKPSPGGEQTDDSTDGTSGGPDFDHLQAPGDGRHGADVLNSQRAIEASVYVVRAFVKMR
jgi:hypothetical protein